MQKVLKCVYDAYISFSFLCMQYGMRNSIFASKNGNRVNP